MNTTSPEDRANDKYQGMVKFTLSQVEFCYQQVRFNFQKGNYIESSMCLLAAAFDVFPMLPLTAVFDAITLPVIFAYRRIRQTPK